MTRPDAVILDMDGSLVDVSGILHHVTQLPKNYHQFHLDSATCPPHDIALDYIAAHVDAGRQLVVITGRQEQYRDLTVDWLTNTLPPDFMHHIAAIYMRDNDDRRSAPDVKLDLYEQAEHHYNLISAIEDDPRIITLWRSLGIHTLAVPRDPNEPDRDTSAKLIEEANQKDPT